MNGDTLLIIIMGGLGAIELGLIWSIRKLTKVLNGMNEKIKIFDAKVSNIEGAVVLAMHKVKEFSAGEFRIKGKSPFGDLDLSLDLHSKEHDELIKKYLRGEAEAPTKEGQKPIKRAK